MADRLGAIGGTVRCGVRAGARLAGARVDPLAQD